MIFRSLFALTFTALPLLASAQAPSTLTIDSSFRVEGHGQKVRVGGSQAYPLVTAHKVLTHNGRTVVCIGYAGAARKEFMQKSRILSSQGKVIKSGLHKASKMGNTPAVVAARQARKTRSALYILAYPLEPQLFVGTKVRCQRSNKRFQDHFLDGKSVLKVPERIWVPQ